MNRNTSILLAGTATAAVVLICALVWRHLGGCGNTGPAIIKPSPAPTLEYRLTEAESPVSSPSGVMKIIAANDASGNRAMAVPADAGNEDGRADYRLPELAPAAYRVWLRAFWLDGCGNSVGCAAGEHQMVFTDGIFDKWHWLTVPKPVEHPGGDLYLSLIAREAGIMIDQILLTPDANLVPNGIMPGR